MVVSESTHRRSWLTPFVGGAPWFHDFFDLTFEWRRLFAELVGTFLLVIAGAGGAVVAANVPGAVGRGGLVIAPALTVMAVILATGAVSGAHLNPIVSIAFWLRREFPLARVPLYILFQIAGGVAACAFLWAMFGKTHGLGTTLPGPGITNVHAMWMEAVLTFGLITTILGTASGAQNVGSLSAIAVAGYISLAGLWGSVVSGASMNPVRSFAPALLTGHFSDFWVYLAGPTIGMIVAIGVAFVLRGPGGDLMAARAAQGNLGQLDLPTSNEANHGTRS